MTILAIETLLEPISSAPPCGVDLQYDPAYDSIRLARQVKNQQLPTGVWEKEEKSTDWHGIGRDCAALLLHRSKDLQVAAWLTEGWVNTQGLTGLRAGLQLMDRLSHKYWEDIHPLPDHEDWSNRLRAFEWLGRELPGWCKTHLWGDSVEVSSTRQESLESVLTSLTNVQNLLESKLNETVVTINESVKRLKAQLQQWQAVGAEPSEQAAPFRSSISSRAAAYEQLRGVAEFLARHEPHSPVPEILRAISEWQNYEFGELLALLPANGPSVYDLARLFTLSRDRS